MSKGIWVTVYPPRKRPHTHGLRNWKELETFLQPLRCEATVRDQSGKLRFNFTDCEAHPGMFGLALSPRHPDVVARVKRRREIEAARENQSSPAETPALPG